MRSPRQGFSVAARADTTASSIATAGSASALTAAVHGTPSATGKVDERASAFTVAARTFLAFVLPAFLAVAGSVVACYNDVPGPQGPLPSPMREVPPQGPAPGPIVPGPVTAPHVVPALDGGLPVPAPPPQTSTPPALGGAQLQRPHARVATSSGAPRSPARLTIPIGATPSPHATVSRGTTPSQGATTASFAIATPSSDPPPPTQSPQQPPPKQAPPVDAGVDSTADLPPEIPDAGGVALPDAGQPL